MSSTNPDFVFSPERVLADADPARARTLLEERDHRLEDFLNRHVVRRVRAVNGLGNNTDYSTTA